MEVLARTSQREGRATRVALLVTGLLGAGCLVMETLGVESHELAFSHRLHVGEEGLECFLCHQDYEDSDDPGMPTAAACALCHEGIDADKSPERRVEQLFDGEMLKTSRVHALGDDVIFSHQFHVTDEEGCMACHAEIVESDALRPWMAVGMDDCVACHESVGARTECAACHERIDVDAPPWTHDGTWEKHHGLSVRNRTSATVDRCDLCHKESSCVECHLENPPASHNNFWRRRGHALTASLDRQTCAACHTPDFCNRCHESTAPISHRGSWGSPRNNHCLGCHLADPDPGCLLCHQEIVSHDMATPIPPGHDPMSDCRECHTFLVHADNGESCLLCHR